MEIAVSLFFYNKVLLRIYWKELKRNKKILVRVGSYSFSCRCGNVMQRFIVKKTSI